MSTPTGLNGPDVLNSIRNVSSAAYQNAVPIAQVGNLQDVGNPILTYQSVQNEFLTALVNQIALIQVNRRMFNNPLAYLKSGATPLGLDVEDIYINPAESQEYDPNAFNGILTPVTPDVKAAYYRRNRQHKYKATIKNNVLRAAFRSWDGLEQLIAGIIDSLYNGNTIGEYGLTKGLLGGACAKGLLPQNVMPAPSTKAEAEAFVASIRSQSLLFMSPSSAYNSYALQGGTGNPVITWTQPEDQIIIITAAVAAQVDVLQLSAAFNLAYSDYLARQIVVDQFNGAPNMYAFVGDRRIFQIRENLRQMTEFYNAEVMAWSYWWHCWDTYALSPFANGVAYVTQEYPKA